MNGAQSALPVGDVSQFWSLGLIDFVLTALAMYPLIGFMVYGWNRRAQEISELLSAKAKKRYLELFRKSNPDEELASAEFNKFYREWYGRQYFVIPILFLGVVLIIGNFILAKSLVDLLEPGRTSSQFGVAAAALAGAYTFVCSDFIARLQRRNLTRADILRSTLRLSVAIFLGYAFSSLLNASLAPFVAFAIGAFPLQAISTILQRQMRARLELGPESDLQRDHVTVLFGIDNATAERIEDADITTVAQLAWCDPIQLTMRSNLQFAYVIDIMSQALAWVYFENKLKLLGTVGLRGAIEIRTMLRRLCGNDLEGALASAIQAFESPESDDSLERVAARAALTAAAKIAGVEPLALAHAFFDIGKDPITEFLDICWRSFTARPGA
jgi:hypothetical protein